MNVNGEISYAEGNQAWNVIRLKKELLKEFPQLKNKRGKFSYDLLVHRSYKDLKTFIEGSEKDKDVLPILLFLCSDE